MLLIAMVNDEEKPSYIPPRKHGTRSSPRNSGIVASATPPPVPPHQNNSTSDSVSKPKQRIHQKHQLQLTPKQSVEKSKEVPQHKVVFAAHQSRRPPPERLTSRNNSSDCSTDDVTPADDSNTERKGVKWNQNTIACNSSYTDVDVSSEKTVLNTFPRVSQRSVKSGFVTMTGTVKRGRKKGQTMDMTVQISKEELEELGQRIIAKQKEDQEDCFFGVRKGPHVLLMTIFLIPVVFFISGSYSFYMGTMTWYNILVLFSDKKTIVHKVFISPFLIIFYPFLIILSIIGLGVYASIVQVSWHYERWVREVQDWEKGFYGWLCCALNVEDCSPYEVVILTEIQQGNEAEKMKPQVLDTAL